MRKQIASLNCLVREGEDDDSAIVILHGYGADANDLYSLAEFMDPEERWNFYFPNAPFALDFGGRGWFPISVRDLETAVDFTQVRPPGLDESASKVFDVIFELNKKNVVLGGFSQGAMISTEVALKNASELKGLLLWSGTMLDEKTWSKEASALEGMPVFQSHGQSDPVLPFVFAQRLNAALIAGGATTNLMGFPGGHQIPMPVLQKSKAFLEGIL